ncbi:MAG: YbaB/EbfC family nucleoid-associated protein [Deltaproteobacteria bacterium]|nr:YbaB/EbfC family nucleoid-associated protein [Deltaproteobacteria bacterium]
MSKGFGGLGDIVKQAQQLQERLGQVQEEASAKTVEASAGGGMVTAVMNGKLELLSLRIEPEIAKSGDVEMLQDLILAAVNQAVRNAQQMMAEEMKKVTGGLKIPGLNL